jgi:hypothetical protein
MKTAPKKVKLVAKVAPKTVAPPVNSTVSTDEHTQRIINVRKIMRERDRCRLETEDFAKSDMLRDRLKDLGVAIIDQLNGPSGWKFIDGSTNKLKPGTAVPDDAIRKRKMEESQEPQTKPSKSPKAKGGEDKPEVQSSSKTYHLNCIRSYLQLSIKSLTL